MNSTLSKSLNEYGSDVAITYGGETVSSKAFITPLCYKNRVYIGQDYYQAGVLDKGRYMYVGPPDIRLDNIEGDIYISDDINCYVVKRAELFCFRGKPLYVWAVLIKKQEGAYDDTNFG